MADNREDWPDCAYCYLRHECERACDGTYCPKWRSAPPETREPDPNDVWRKGGEPPW